MTERVVRLGIDYGTSFSKIVFRDYGAPGGEKAFVMLTNGDFRTPSAVGIEGEEFIFGIDPGRKRQSPSTIWHESVKMRVAGEVKQDFGKYCHGPLAPLPNGFSAKDLAVLSVWFLLSESKRAVRQHLKSFSGTVAIGFTLGMPMSFFDDLELRSTFLQISRVSWELSKRLDTGETISFDEARRHLESGYAEVEKSRDVPLDEIKDWIRTEAEAAIWWPFMSPAVAPDPYAQIDIGAGTTNISIFRIVPQHTSAGWVKSSVSFFGATSPPVGMDAIDRALAEWKGGNDVFEWRGREDQLLYGKRGNQLISHEARQISDAYKHTLNKAFSTHLQSHAERHAWEAHKIFFLGGGSLIACLVERLCISPLDVKTSLSPADLDVPSDIRLGDGTEVPSVMFPHVAVAYGLSGFSAELPNVETPSQTPPMGPVNPPSRRYQNIEMDEWRY